MCSLNTWIDLEILIDSDISVRQLKSRICLIALIISHVRDKSQAVVLSSSLRLMEKEGICFYNKWKLKQMYGGPDELKFRECGILLLLYHCFHPVTKT